MHACVSTYILDISLLFVANSEILDVLISITTHN